MGAQRRRQDLTCPRRPTRRGSARLCPGRSRHRPAAPTRWRRCWAASSSCPCWRGSGRRPGGPAAPPRRNLAPCPSPPALWGEDGVSKGSASPRSGTGVPPSPPQSPSQCHHSAGEGFFFVSGGPRALTSGHLDELGDAEHPRGHEAFLEVCRVCTGERGEGAKRGWGPSASPRAPHISLGHPWEPGG